MSNLEHQTVECSDHFGVHNLNFDHKVCFTFIKMFDIHIILTFDIGMPNVKKFGVHHLNVERQTI